MGITSTHEELLALLSQITLILANFNFRMASNKSLNAACDLDGYLFCKMHVGTLKVEVKVKTTWGKFMLQDIHTRTEKYCMWEKADGRSTIKTRKRKASHKMTTMQTKDNLKQMYQWVKGLGIPLKSSQIPRMQWQYPKWRKKEKQNRKVNSWPSIVNFVIDVANHIAGVILLIGKKEC